MTTARYVSLEKLRLTAQQRIGRYVADSMQVHEVASMLADDIVYQLEAAVLAETLPPDTVTSTVEFSVPRFRSWRDHLFAAHRGRWWLGWLPAPRFVDEPHSHRTVVTVRARWTYPRATTVLPGRDYGHVVLRADTVSWDASETPW